MSDSEISLDEIDLDHQRSLGPKLRSKSMRMQRHNWESEGALLATYAHVLNEDMHILFSYIQEEYHSLFGGLLIHEYTSRKERERMQSSERLMALQRRYAQSKADMKENHLAAVNYSPTEVQGLKTFFSQDSTKDEKLKQKLIVQHLLERPEVLHRTALRPKNIGNIYNKPAQTAWDGTVYKNTLIQSLNVKLQYKLYFEALKHNAVSIRNARLAVEPIAYKRLKKLMRICFYSLLHEFLEHRHRISTGSVKANLLTLQKYIWPSFQVLLDNKNRNKKDQSLVQRSEKWHDRFRSRQSIRSFDRYAKLSIFFNYSTDLVKYFRLTRMKRKCLQKLKHKNYWCNRVVRANKRVSHLMLTVHAFTALNLIRRLHQGKRHMYKCLQQSKHFRFRHVMGKSIHALKRWAKMNKRKKKSVRVAQMMPYEMFMDSFQQLKSYSENSKYVRGAEDQADEFCYVNSIRIGLASFKRFRRNSQVVHIQSAKSVERYKNLTASIESFKRAKIIKICAYQAMRRGLVFFKSNKGLEAFDIMNRRRVSSSYQILQGDLSDSLYVQRRLSVGLLALRNHLVVRRRCRILKQWAAERSVRACAGKAYSAWIYAYVRKSTLRLALESKLRKDNRAIKTHADMFSLVHKAADWVEDLDGDARTTKINADDEDVIQLEASLVKLRAEAEERLYTLGESDRSTAEMMLEDVDKVVILRSSMKNVTERAKKLQKIKRSPSKISKELSNLQLSSSSKRINENESLINETADASFYYHKYLSRLAVSNDVNQSINTSVHSVHAPRHTPLPASTIKRRMGSSSTIRKHRDRGSNSNVPRILMSGNDKESSGTENSDSDGGHDISVGSPLLLSQDMGNSHMKDSSLIKLFKHAHTIQKSKVQSSYLESDLIDNNKKSTKKRSNPSSSPEKLLTGKSKSKTTTGDGDGGSDSDVLHSKVFSHQHQHLQSFQSQRLLERSLEITANDAIAFTSMSRKQYSRKNKNDKDSEDNSDSDSDEEASEFGAGAAGPLDLALKLIQQGRWALFKLKRNSSLNIQSRKVRMLDLKYKKTVAMIGWKKVHSEFEKMEDLCAKIAEQKARRRVIKWLYFRGITRLKSVELSVSKLLKKNCLAETMSLWSRSAHLKRANRLLVLSCKILKLRKSMRAWKWSKSHVRGMTMLRQRVGRRVLFPVIGFWRAKIKKIVKLKNVFKICDLYWRLRWELMYNRSAYSRMNEVFIAWGQWMLINDKEKAEVRKEQKAVLFCRATLIVRCFFAWSDFRRHLVGIKRAKERHLRMIQRVCLTAMAEEAIFTREALVGARSFHRRYILDLYLKAWHKVKNDHHFTIPSLHLFRNRARLFFDEMRTMQRSRVLSDIMIPHQGKRKMGKIFSSWKRMYIKRLRISIACEKLDHARSMLKLRIIFKNWPGRASFRKAEGLKKYNDERGRSSAALVDVNHEVLALADMEKARIKKEQEHRSFIQVRQQAPIQRRAALFGIIYSENDAKSVSILFNTLRAVLFAWSDIAHEEASLRGMHRLVKYRHKRWLLLQHLRKWITKSASTSHRTTLWVTRKFQETHHENLDVDMRSIATQHLVDEFSKLGMHMHLKKVAKEVRFA